MNGFLNLYKPKGVSSAFVLNQIKRSVRGETVGHMGTLDPLASGVLPVAIGKSARLFDFLLDKSKTYVADFAFGYETDTLDLEGKVIRTSPVIPTEEEIAKVLPSLCGDVDQIPPLFSAKCVNGKRGYELARKGKEFSLPPKRVRIEKIELLGQAEENKYRFLIVCGGGTYIRSIARDIGEALGSCATMTDLVRRSSGIFDMDSSVTAEEFANAEDKKSLLIPPDEVVSFPKLELTAREAERLFNGLYDRFSFPDGIYRVYEPNGFYGVGILTDGKLKVKAYIRDNENS